MNYELAKKLKEAGFPIAPTIIANTHFKGSSIPQLFVDANKRFPTLEELIKECEKGTCGWGFTSLSWEGRRSNYIAEGRALNDDRVEGLGLTPEEAVANLYLALNKDRKK